MDSFRSEKLVQRPARPEPGLVKMLLLSVLLHLLLIALYLSPWLQQSSAPMPPVYEVSLVNAPVMNPQAGRPEATAPTEPTPAPAEPVPAPPPPPPPEPAPEPEIAPEPEPEALAEPDPEPEPVPEPEPEPELVPAIDELEEQRLAEEQRRREEAERLAEEQRKREEAEKQRLAEEQRKREEAEKRRLAEEQRKREEAEKQRLAEERRKREEAENRRLAEEQRQLQQRLDELAAKRQLQEEEDARQRRLDDLRAAARRESRQVESPIPDAPVGMPDGRGTEAGVSPSAFVRTFIQQNWTFAGHQAVGNPEAEVYLLYNASGSLISHRFIRRSGNSAFDESLLRAVTLSRQLPQPLPQTMEFRVVFNLKEMLNR